MSRYTIFVFILIWTNIGFSQEIKDERILVDELGLEANLGLPTIVGVGVSYSLKLRGIPVYPSFILKGGVGPIVKREILFGLNYRKEATLSYSLNYGYSGGETFVFDTHAGQPIQFHGAAVNLQRRKYIGKSKYWCLSQVVGLDVKRYAEPIMNPKVYIYPYFEIGIYFMIL